MLTPCRLAVGKGLNLELVFECVVVTAGVEMEEKLTFTDERERVCVCELEECEYQQTSLHC